MFTLKGCLENDCEAAGLDIQNMIYTTRSSWVTARSAGTCSLLPQRSLPKPCLNSLKQHNPSRIRHTRAKATSKPLRLYRSYTCCSLHAKYGVPYFQTEPETAWKTRGLASLKQSGKRAFISADKQHASQSHRHLA